MPRTHFWGGDCKCPIEHVVVPWLKEDAKILCGRSISFKMAQECVDEISCKVGCSNMKPTWNLTIMGSPKKRNLLFQGLPGRHPKKKVASHGDTHNLGWQILGLCRCLGETEVQQQEPW